MTATEAPARRAVVVRVPGRAALAGDHLDYLGGSFLAMALDRRVSVHATWLASGDEAVVTSARRHGEFRYRGWTGRETGWRRYAAAVLAQLESAGVTVRPARLAVRSDLPTGRGLGSSGSFSVAVAAAVVALNGMSLDRRRVLDLCLRAERERVGAKVGLMDQYVPLFTAPGVPVLVHAPTATHESIAIPAGWAAFVVDPLERRSLLHTRFNDRGAECAEALRLVRSASPGIRSLTDQALGPAELKVLPDVLRRRAEHVRTEHQRVVAAAAALRGADMPALAAIMAESHRSFSDRFQISTPVLDAAAAAVAEAARRAGVTAGVKLSGGGFGGALVGITDARTWLSRSQELLSAALGRRVVVWASPPAAGIELEEA